MSNLYEIKSRKGVHVGFYVAGSAEEAIEFARLDWQSVAFSAKFIRKA